MRRFLYFGGNCTAVRSDSELKVITKSKDLISYILSISENAPKKYRFTLVSKMQNLSLDILENLIFANEIMLDGKSENLLQRREHQHTAIADLKVLDAVAMIARQNSCILPKQYENISKMIYDCVKLTGGWMNSDIKRTV